MPLTIGKLSKATAVNVETIRYYERIGLLAAPSRTESGYRTFSEQDAARLRFIKRGRELGFSLDEIRTMVELQRLEAELQRLAGCSESSVRECRIIETLTGVRRP